jgi:hypothetical protein
MSRLYSPSEWVAPLVPLLSLLVLPLGPLLFPKPYLFLLFAYFTVFLYTQVNHVCKFYMTSCKIRSTIARWNKRLAQQSLQPSSQQHHTSVTSRQGSPNLTRERNNNSNAITTTTSTFGDDHVQILDEMERLESCDGPSFVHAFIIPNYCEPEGLLKDTIGRMANHRYAARR